MILKVGFIIVDILVVLAIVIMLCQPRWPEPYERPFACDQCHRTYRDATTLTQHKTAMHPDKPLLDEEHSVRLLDKEPDIQPAKPIPEQETIRSGNVIYLIRRPK